MDKLDWEELPEKIRNRMIEDANGMTGEDLYDKVRSAHMHGHESGVDFGTKTTTLAFIDAIASSIDDPEVIKTILEKTDLGTVVIKKMECEKESEPYDFTRRSGLSNN